MNSRFSTGSFHHCNGAKSRKVCHLPFESSASPKDELESSNPKLLVRLSFLPRGTAGMADSYTPVGDLASQNKHLHSRYSGPMAAYRKDFQRSASTEVLGDQTRQAPLDLTASHPLAVVLKFAYSLPFSSIHATGHRKETLTSQHVNIHSRNSPAHFGKGVVRAHPRRDKLLRTLDHRGGCSR